MSSAPLTPAELRCAYRVNPLGVAPGQVRLSWLLHGPGRDRAQSGYQVQVAADKAGQAMDPGPDWNRPEWDSGRVRSEVCAGIGYAGQDLRRGSRYAWQVRTWDESEAVSEWSEPALVRQVEPRPGHRLAGRLDRPGLAAGGPRAAGRGGPVRPGGQGPAASPLPAAGIHAWTGRWPQPGCTSPRSACMRCG